MRIIGSKQQGNCIITFFHWNNKYLIKLESGPFEQTYKVQEYDLAGEEELIKIISDEFIEECLMRFQQMADSLQKSIERL